MTATAESAVELAVMWLREVVHHQPYGDVRVSVSLKGGNVVCIRKSIEEVTSP